MEGDNFTSFMPSLLAASMFQVVKYMETGQTNSMDAWYKVAGYIKEDIKTCIGGVQKFLATGEHSKKVTNK